MAIGGSMLGMGLVFTLKDQFSATAKKVSNSIELMQDRSIKASERINQSMDMISSSFLSTGIAVSALLLPFGAAISKSAEFDAQMSDVQAKSNASATEIGLLRDQALRLSSAQETANFTAKQAAEAQSFLAMAGFNTNQIMDSMQGTLFLASAGSLDLAKSADIASNTLAQFGLRASDMNRVADVIANAAVSSNQSVEQFADGMKFFGSTARALNVPLEEAASTMMLLANAGLQGSLGTRALGTSLASRLTKPTKDASIIMKQLGFDAFDVQGNFLGMSDMIRTLDKSLVGLSPKMRQMAISTIFGGEAIQEVNTLLMQEVEIMKDGQKVILKGADAIDHFTKSNENAAGVAARIAKTKLDNLKGDFTVMLSNVETVLIKIGAALTPALRPLLQVGSVITSIFGAILDTDIGRWAVMAAAGMAVATAGVMVLNFAIGTLTKSFWKMMVAAFSASAPLLPYIAIGFALVGVVMLVKKGIDEFNTVLEGGSAKTGFLGFLQKVGGMFLGIVEIFRTWNGETFKMSKNMRDSLQKIGILEFFLDLSTWIVRTIELFKGIGDGVVGGLKVIGKLFVPALDMLGSLFSKLGFDVDKAFGSLEAWFEVGKQIGILIAGVLIGVIAILIVKMVILAATVIAATWPILLIIAIIGALVYAFMNWGKITQWFGEIWDTVVTFISNKFGEFTDWFFSLPAKFMAVSQKIGDSIAIGIKTAILKLKGFGQQLMNNLFGGEMGAKLGLALGLTNSSDTGNITPVGNPLQRTQDNGGRMLAENRSIASRPETILNNTNTETVKSFNLSIEMDGEEIAKKMVEKEEMDFSRQ